MSCSKESGSLAMLAAMRLASSRVRRCIAVIGERLSVGVANAEALGGLVNVPWQREAAAFGMAIVYAGLVLAGA